MFECTKCSDGRTGSWRAEENGAGRKAYWSAAHWVQWEGKRCTAEGAHVLGAYWLTRDIEEAKKIACARGTETREGRSSGTKEQREWARNENAGQWATSQRHAVKAPPAY